MLERLQYLEVRMYEGDRRRWFGQPEYQRLVEQLWKLGAPGVTVMRADEGFDRRGHLQNIHSEYLSDNLPVTLEFIGEVDELRQAVERIKGELKQPLEAWVTRDAMNVKGSSRISGTTDKGASHSAESTPGLRREAQAVNEIGGRQGMNGILKVYCKEQDEVKGVPLVRALPEALHEHGVNWINVFQALQGFGQDHVMRKNATFSFSNHAPIIVEAVLSQDVDVNQLLHYIHPLLQSASGPAILIPGQFLNI